MSERYLANENFPAAIVKMLREQGNDVIHVAETLVGAGDQEILHIAVRDDRIILTMDRDFGELIVRCHNVSVAGVVFFRMVQQPPEFLISQLRTFFQSKPVLRGFFTVASPGHFRQVPLEAVEEE
jgi:predicted nuclease of predicted toxin-antitoxin system